MAVNLAPKSDVCVGLLLYTVRAPPSGKQDYTRPDAITAEHCEYTGLHGERGTVCV